jgi:hypothetical protein
MVSVNLSPKKLMIILSYPNGWTKGYARSYRFFISVFSDLVVMVCPLMGIKTVIMLLWTMWQVAKFFPSIILDIDHQMPDGIWFGDYIDS